MRIAVVGTGYVGLVTGVCFAEVGHDVICFDNDPDKIGKLNNDISPIYEPGIEQLIHRNRSHERLWFSCQFEEWLKSHTIEDGRSVGNDGSVSAEHDEDDGVDVIFIAVGTPQDEDGSADLQYIEQVAHQIGNNHTKNIVVVTKSTVPVGTGDRVEEILNEHKAARKTSHSIRVASNPEFLAEGAAIRDCMKPDRVVVGINEQSLESVFRRIYQPFILDDPGKLLFTSRRSSELIKYASNAMLATRVSFMNELSRLCEDVGANIDHVRYGMGTDPRIGKKFLYAGPGYGGSCFPKDVKALIHTSDSYGQNLTLLKAVDAANKAQHDFVFGKIKRYFDKEHGGLSGKKICLWGLAFKPGTDDVREAPAAHVIQKLTESGAEVIAHDPKAMESFGNSFKIDGLQYAKDPYNALEGSDALVLMTEWPEYRRPSWAKVKDLVRIPSIFDFRNQYDGHYLRKHGFYYECVGRVFS